MGSSRDTVSGWKLRNAYKFLDNYMDSDMAEIKKQIKKNKYEIKRTKKRNANGESRHHVHSFIKEKDAAITVLKSELIKIQNRKNRINEMDLEQKSKSDMRKLELDQVRTGEKRIFHHSLKRTRFGAVKWTKEDKNGNSNANSIQNIYLQNKYDKLKADGKYEKYKKKKMKRVNSRYKAALQKKSGQGWNDN